MKTALTCRKTAGLHRVTVREVADTRLRIGPIEAVDGTPVVDVKVLLASESATPHAR